MSRTRTYWGAAARGVGLLAGKFHTVTTFIKKSVCWRVVADWNSAP